MLAEATQPLARVNVPGFLVGRFEVTLIGRFWVTPEGLFRNQQSRTALKWRPWFYLRLVAYRSFWLSERA